MKTFIRVLLVICLVFGSIFAAYFWGKNGQSLAFERDILVLNQDVGIGTKIESNMLEKSKIKVSYVAAGVLDTPEVIVGKKSVIVIKKGVPLTSDMLSVDIVTLEKGEKIFSIPTSWIVTLPQTLRRGDLVSIYSVVRSSAGDVPVTTFLFDVEVIYVKDTSNKEVVTNNSGSFDNRLEASGSISSVEIKLTEEMQQTLINSTMGSGQLILTYKRK